MAEVAGADGHADGVDLEDAEWQGGVGEQGRGAFVQYLQLAEVPFVLRPAKKGLIKAEDGDLGIYTMIGEAYV